MNLQETCSSAIHAALSFVVLVLLPQLAVAAPADEARIELTFRAVDSDALSAPSSESGEATILAEPITADLDARSVDVSVSGGQVVSLSLPEGLWRLLLQSEHFWTPPATLDVGTTTALELPLHRLGRALVTLEAEGEPPDRLVVDFDETAFRGQDGSGLRGRLDCRPIGNRWACPVPVGIFDLGLRARSRVPHFVWSRGIPAHPAIDLGQVALVRGASLTGEVRRADDELLPERVTARLERRGRRPETTTVSGWGFFQFAGLDTGDYRLTVEAEGFADAVVDHVRIQPNTEAGLQHPVILHRPVDVSFRLTPPHDLTGEPWRLDLLDRAPLPSRVARGRTGEDGLWRAARLAPGGYRLFVASADGARVLTEDLEVDASTRTIDLEIATIWVEGRVTLGDQPLPATLSWGGRDGMVSVSMVSDDDGRYTGLLPRDGAWALDVESSAPKIFRRLGGVEVDPLGGSTARVDIELPDTSLEIEVVDASGEAVPTAGVFLVRWSPPHERPSAERVDEEGRLVWRGLAPATYRVEALDHATGTPRRSDAVEAVLDEDAPDASVRLVLQATVELAGRLVTPHGSPIPGAMVRASRSPGAAISLQAPTAQTDPEGRFRLALAPGAERTELSILAPGFLLTIVDVQVSPGREETFVLNPAAAGGTLTLHTPPPADDGVLRSGANLRHGTRPLPLGVLREWALAQGHKTTTDRLTVPAMPSGPYSLCLPDEPTACAEGVLLPGLALDLGQQLVAEAEDLETETHLTED